LSERLDGLKNATVAVKEWEGEIVFLHQVKSGAADRSYGVQVARLAGLPDAVITRAKDVLTKLETGVQKGAVKPDAILDGLPLFSAEQAQPALRAEPSKLYERMKDIMPDNLSPRDALELIYELKDLAEDPKG
jgi:DNA mismatch repair protein MutS